MQKNNELRPLTDTEIQVKLKEIPTWMHANEKLRKQFTFKNFSEAAKFLNKLAPFCDKLEHHPKVKLFDNQIVFTTHTLSAGGKVTDLDFTIAKEIERLYGE